MRELKFRAWDKHSNKMIQPHDGDFIKWHAMSNWRECLNVMQYTGRKDMNGVEIYEGYIVIGKTNILSIGIKGVVFFLTKTSNIKSNKKILAFRFVVLELLIFLA